MSKLQKKLDILEKKSLKLFINRDKVIKKLDEEYDSNRDVMFKLQHRIYHMQDLQRKNCHHKKEYGRTQHQNMRDDASFKWYVNCKKCGETMWDECYGPSGGYG